MIDYYVHYIRHDEKPWVVMFHNTDKWVQFQVAQVFFDVESVTVKDKTLIDDPRTWCFIKANGYLKLQDGVATIHRGVA